MSQYAGAAVAVTLFDRVAPSGVAWLRVAFSALILVAWRQGSLRAAGSVDGQGDLHGRGVRSWPLQRWRAVVLFGTALAAMNLCFYLAIGRLPLGTAVAIEFCGPITVAALGTRGRRNVVALGIAVTGVALLADVQWEASPAGVGFALAAAALWAGYIVAGPRIGRPGPAATAGTAGSAGSAEPAGTAGVAGTAGLDGLAVASVVGALVIAPAGLASLDGVTVGVAAAAAVVGLLSNVVPYALDQLVFPRLAAGQFALLSTLLPATAALTGALVLAQRPSPVEAAGIVAVIAAVGIAERP